MSVSLAAADEQEFARQFRQAELRETAFGDLRDAAERYAAAAKIADDAGSRARAELRAGSCLRRLGDAEGAARFLRPLVEREGAPEDVRRAARAELASASVEVPSAPPADEPAPSADRKLLAEREQELETMRGQFEALLRRTQGLERETEKLAGEILRKDKENAAMRSQIEPASAEEALRLRIAERERRRRADRDLSNAFASFARRLHQEGRFTEARDFAHAAIDKDAENADANALLTLVSAPLGVRERLYEEIRGVLALSAAVRGARRAAEFDALLAEARARQQKKDFASSAPLLERALALVAQGAAHVLDEGAAREEALALLRRAQAHGVARAELPAVVPESTDDRGLAAVRELLVFSGEEVVRGLALGFHDAGPLLAAAAAGLPPAPLGPPPEGWTLSVEGVDAAPLLAEQLRAADEQAFARPGASIDAAAATLVALCEPDAQARLHERLLGMSDVTAPAADVRVSAFRVRSGVAASALAARGVRARGVPGGANAGVVPPADADAFVAELAKAGSPWPSEAAFRASHLRSFRLLAGVRPSTLSLDVLPATRPGPGLAVRAVSTWAPPGRDDAALLRQEAAAAAALPPGAALALFGVADPTDPSRDLVLVVRLGSAPPAPARAPLPPPVPGLSSSEILLPAALRGLVEVGPEPLVVPGRPVPSRRDALASRLRAVARGAQSVEVAEDRVRVVGPEEARDAARRFLAQADVVRGLQTFEVAAYAVTADAESRLFAEMPKLERRPGEDVGRVMLRGDERRNAELALAGTRGRLFAQRVAAPSTGRADAAYVVRTSFRHDVEVTEGDAPAWGRAESGLADEGVLVAIRPFGRRDTGRVDVDVALRTAWVQDKGERSRATPLGTVVSTDPVLANWAGDLATTLADDELLVLAGLPNPLSAGGDRTRLVITVSVAR